MRILGNWVAVSLVGLAAFAVQADAAPLDLKHVAADASWLAHVDIDATRESIVMQKAMEKQKHADRKEMVKKMLGMDPDKDLHGMTFYGREIGKHKGVMILHARMNRDRILEMALTFTKPTVTEYGKHKLHSWSRKSRHSGKTHNLAAVFYGEDAVVLASSVDELKQAVDVLEGKSPSVKPDAPLGGNIPAGTTMLMRVEGISDAELPDKCKLAKQIKSFRFVTGEHEGESFYRSRSVMTNEDVVGDLKQIVEGLRALGNIHVGNNEAGKRLVDGLRIKAEGTRLTVLWSAPAEDVWTILDAHRKIVEEKMKKHRSRYGRSRHHDWRKRWGHHDGKRGPESEKKKEISPEEDF